MARRVSKQGKAAPTPGAAGAGAAADELEILHPHRAVQVAGVSLTVREYGFVEGLQVRALAKPFLEALYQVVGGGNRVPSFDEVQDVLANHDEAVVQLIARSAAVDAAWVRTLGDEDGELLMLNWWMANAGFFIRRVLRRASTDRLVAAALAGDGSTTPSSAPAMDPAPQTSETSPNAS